MLITFLIKYRCHEKICFSWLCRWEKEDMFFLGSTTQNVVVSQDVVMNLIKKVYVEENKSCYNLIKSSTIHIGIRNLILVL